MCVFSMHAYYVYVVCMCIMYVSMCVCIMLKNSMYALCINSMFLVLYVLCMYYVYVYYVCCSMYLCIMCMY